jgi:hypothetical protein
VGVLAVVAAVLAVAGPAAGLSGVGGEVARAVRTGVCIVGGDVCRAADAKAAGLEPCTLSDRRRGGRRALTVLSVRLGDGSETLVARRSDGSVSVVRADEGELGASGGIGFEAGPVKVGADGRIASTFLHATGWELPDAAAAKRFLATLGSWEDARRWPPAWRSGEAGAVVGGSAGLGVRLGKGEDSLGASVAGVEASAEAALGARVGRGRTTIYIRTEAQGPRLTDALGRSIDAGSVGPVVAEYTRDRGGPRELAFRVTHAGVKRGEVVETVARLDLRVPANLAVAQRVLAMRAPWPPAMLGDLRAVIRHTAAVGTVERSVYAVDDGSMDLALAGRLGAELGVEVGRTKVDRRLVSASAWTAGSRERAREDCLA